METINIPDTMPVSLKKMVDYFHSKFKLNISINEDFIKNILDDDHTYYLYTKGKNKNNVKIVKKRKKENTKLYIDKKKYINENNEISIKNTYNTTTNICKRCPEIMLKYAVERIINLKYLSNNISLYKSMNKEVNNYKYLEKSFLTLIDNYHNICNIIKNIKINLDNLYKKLSEYKQLDSKQIIINIIEYEIMLRNIIKITPTNDFINILAVKRI